MKEVHLLSQSSSPSRVEKAHQQGLRGQTKREPNTNWSWPRVLGGMGCGTSSWTETAHYWHHTPMSVHWLLARTRLATFQSSSRRFCKKMKTATEKNYLSIKIICRKVNQPMDRLFSLAERRWVYSLIPGRKREGRERERRETRTYWKTANAKKDDIATECHLATLRCISERGWCPAAGNGKRFVGWCIEDKAQLQVIHQLALWAGNTSARWLSCPLRCSQVAMQGALSNIVVAVGKLTCSVWVCVWVSAFGNFDSFPRRDEWRDISIKGTKGSEMIDNDIEVSLVRTTRHLSQRWHFL